MKTREAAQGKVIGFYAFTLRGTRNGTTKDISHIAVVAPAPFKGSRGRSADQVAKAVVLNGISKSRPKLVDGFEEIELVKLSSDGKNATTNGRKRREATPTKTQATKKKATKKRTTKKKAASKKKVASKKKKKEAGSKKKATKKPSTRKKAASKKQQPGPKKKTSGKKKSTKKKKRTTKKAAAQTTSGRKEPKKPGKKKSKKKKKSSRRGISAPEADRMRSGMTVQGVVHGSGFGGAFTPYGR
jgi:hypothetical protein